MQQIGIRRVETALPVQTEGELQDLHARQPVLVPQLLDVRRDDAKVLGDEGKILSQDLVQVLEELLARSFHPFAISGRRVLGRDFPAGRESAEVVDAEDVGVLQRLLDPAGPPLPALLLMGLPVVDRVAPELAVGAERIRRHSAGHFLVALGVQLEEPAVLPDVDRVPGDEDGDVADDAHAPVVGVVLQSGGLEVEEILDDLLEEDLSGILGLEGRERAGVPHLHRLRPGAEPAGIPVDLAERDVERPVVQPPGLFRTEGLERLLPFLVGQEVPGRLEKERALPLADFSIVHPFRVEMRGVQKVLQVQQAFGGQVGQINQKLVARMGRAGRIRAVPVSGGAERQHLPEADMGLGKQIHELAGFVAERADSLPPGKGRGMHQNTATTINVFHM